MGNFSKKKNVRMILLKSRNLRMHAACADEDEEEVAEEWILCERE